MMATIPIIKHRIRLMQLLEAAERAALAPIATDKLHAFAYLADVLSQVWGLTPLDNRIVKTGRTPYYPDLQAELDGLVAMGIVEVSELEYQRRKDGTLAFKARFALNFASGACLSIREALIRDKDAITTQLYLDELAQALASLRDEDISAAASEDVTYGDPNVPQGEIIFFNGPGRLRTTKATDALNQAFPDIRLSPSRRLYMYAHYLGQRVNAVG